MKLAPDDTICVYLAPEKLVENVLAELDDVIGVFDRLVIAQGPPQKSVWAQNIWLESKVLTIKSIGDAAQQLRQIQRNWVFYPLNQHRRAKLIEEQLPPIKDKLLEFPSKIPLAPLGSWTLFDSNTLIASAKCSSPFPNGEYHFQESRLAPPNRAYLKLWEFFTRKQQLPQKGDKVLDLGASPGGWSWVLAKLEAKVIAVDRSPLAPEIARMPNVQFIKANAFSILPKEYESFDWIFSDVVCYPNKLYEWLNIWLDSGRCKNFMLTIKFQGKSHYDEIKKFSAIPKSEVFHLFHNKHELTWCLLGMQ